MYLLNFLESLLLSTIYTRSYLVTLWQISFTTTLLPASIHLMLILDRINDINYKSKHVNLLVKTHQWFLSSGREGKIFFLISKTNFLIYFLIGRKLLYTVVLVSVVCVCSGSQSCLTLSNTVDYIALQAPLFMGFSRQEHWSRFPFPSPGNLTYPRMKPASPESPGLPNSGNQS